MREGGGGVFAGHYGICEVCQVLNQDNIDTSIEVRLSTEVFVLVDV